MIAKRVEIGTKAIESPYLGEGGQKQTEVVPFNFRESNAKTLRLGPAQTKAYDKVWSLYYRMGLNRQMALDPSYEPTDGGGVSDPVPVQAIEAGQELDELQKAIGKDRYRLIVLTCIDGLNYTEVACQIYGAGHSRRDMEDTSFSVKNAYNAAMYHFGYAKPKDTIVRLMRSISDGERATDRPDLREEE